MCNHKKKLISSYDGDIIEVDEEISELLNVLGKCGYEFNGNCQDAKGQIVIYFNIDKFQELVTYSFEKYDDMMEDIENGILNDEEYTLYDFIQEYFETAIFIPDYRTVNNKQLLHGKFKILFEVEIKFDKELRNEFIKLLKEDYKWKLLE